MVVIVNVLDVPPTFGSVRSHPLKALMQESKVVEEIIATYITIKGVIACLIQMLNQKTVGMSYYQVGV